MVLSHGHLFWLICGQLRQPPVPNQKEDRARVAFGFVRGRFTQLLKACFDKLELFHPDQCFAQFDPRDGEDIRPGEGVSGPHQQERVRFGEGVTEPLCSANELDAFDVCRMIDAVSCTGPLRSGEQAGALIITYGVLSNAGSLGQLTDSKP
ncbi:hypothetical protein V473_20985 [Sphingobium cupriresistens LL01]|uniref:Uncharacterized protein n=1 Tax=Sphingobium cupriresistens LL01 TaxID=1420583 RepID=A0A0J8AAV6_9SPHN|nr:hypothetical protein C100_03590 [Sphingobium sp. C100]KMS52330.1 hypothetical protein V473_20985 [Sphingobium cupriresistens LL01]